MGSNRHTEAYCLSLATMVCMSAHTAILGCVVLMCRYDWGSCEAPNKANIERFTATLAKCMKKAVDAGKDIAVLAHLDLEKVSQQHEWSHWARSGPVAIWPVGAYWFVAAILGLCLMVHVPGLPQSLTCSTPGRMLAVLSDGARTRDAASTCKCLTVHLTVCVCVCQHVWCAGLCLEKQPSVQPQRKEAGLQLH
jgi:hypothetical protein